MNIFIHSIIQTIMLNTITCLSEQNYFVISIYIFCKNVVFLFNAGNAIRRNTRIKVLIIMTIFWLLSKSGVHVNHVFSLVSDKRQTATTTFLFGVLLKNQNWPVCNGLTSFSLFLMRTATFYSNNHWINHILPILLQSNISPI